MSVYLKMLLLLCLVCYLFSSVLGTKTAEVGHLEDISVEGKIILKGSLKNLDTMI